MAAQREWFEKDYYKVLGVSEKATEKDLTRAYRKLAKQYHPDTNSGSDEKFKEVSAAYDVLGDVTKRKEYDEVRRLGPLGGGFGARNSGRGAGGAGAAQGGSGGPSNFRFDDLSDLIGGMFNRGGSTAGRGAGAAGPMRGEDLETEIHLSFEDAASGVTTTVNITSDVACGTCGGTGAAPGTNPIICPTCAGRGTQDDNQGFFSFSQPCRTCRGTGMKIEVACPTCKSSGLERRARQVKVRIPAGVEDKSRIRLKQRGGAGHNGGPTGDLYVVVHVAKHNIFGRKGRDLTLTVPVTVGEATLGASVRVPTLDEPVTLKIPAGTRHGKVFRVKGRGSKPIDDAKSTATATGDLLVTVDIVIPESLNEDQRKAMEAFNAATNGAAQQLRKHLGV